MSDDGARYLEQVIRERDAWRRIAELRDGQLARRIVVMLALRKRQARRDVRRARALGDHKAAPFLRTTYESTYCEASNAHELARRILRGAAPE